MKMKTMFNNRHWATTAPIALSLVTVLAVTLSACGEGETFGPQAPSAECTADNPCKLDPRDDQPQYGWSVANVDLGDGVTVQCVVYRTGGASGNVPFWCRDAVAK